ncbi:MAG: APC family permease [Actinomycetota bacterium]|nr:APC family permease [Actinomycetota bacterium]MDQ2956534.1 APC family permease [Actinomycetota bacterium]
MAENVSSPARSKLGGSRKLTLVDAVAQSVGFMGPVFSIAFLVPLLVGLNASGKGAGAAAPLSVLIAAVGILGLGWIVAQYAKRIHAAGSLYDYVTDGLGSRIGSAAGLLYYIGITVLGTGILVMIGGTIYDTIDAEFGKAPLPRLAWDLLLLVGLSIVLYLGVALSTRAQLILALISLTVVLIFFIYVIAKVGSANHVAKAFNPSESPTGLNGVLFGVLYGVLLFTGFETSANLGEETAHPQRDIPRAVILSVLGIAGFYILGAYAQVAGYHFSLDALGKNAGAPLFGLAGPVSDGGVGSILVRRVLELVVILDMIAVLIGCSVAASRGFFAMARDRRLPSSLSRVSRRGTPSTASMAVVAAGLLTVLLTHAWGGLVAEPGLPHYVAMFSWMSTFGSAALAFIYLLMSVGALRGLRNGSRPWAVYLAGGVGILVTAAALFGSIYKVAKPVVYAPYACALVFLLGLALTWVFRGQAGPVTSFAGLAPDEQGKVKL